MNAVSLMFETLQAKHEWVMTDYEARMEKLSLELGDTTQALEEKTACFETLQCSTEDLVHNYRKITQYTVHILYTQCCDKI